MGVLRCGRQGGGAPTAHGHGARAAAGAGPQRTLRVGISAHTRIYMRKGPKSRDVSHSARQGVCTTHTHTHILRKGRDGLGQHDAGNDGERAAARHGGGNHQWRDLKLLKVLLGEEVWQVILHARLGGRPLEEHVIGALAGRGAERRSGVRR